MKKSLKSYIFDSPECFDRYTIIFENGEIWGCSEYPYSPQGFAQSCGNLLNWNWTEPMTVKKYIEYAQKDKTNIGIEVEFNELPDDVQKYVNSIL